MPVTLPPGRARLSTDRPHRIGSTPVITMGIVLVAFLAAWIVGPSCYHDDINLERTSSAASSGEPIGLPSAYRYSMAMFCPSM